MATEKPKFTVIVDEELNKEIEDYMATHRSWSKSATVAYLIKIGLDTIKETQAKEQANK